MTGSLRLARNTTVEACQAALGIEPLLVGQDANLLDVVRSAGRQPGTRVVGVVDAEGRIVGVIPVRRVAESIIARAVPESLLVDVDDEESAVRFSHSVEDRVAADVMLPPATTVPSATIGAAFREMHRRELGGLYIVDDAGRPTGYLDLLELAIVYVRALAEAEAEEEGDPDRGPEGAAAEPGA